MLVACEGSVVCMLPLRVVHVACEGSVVCVACVCGL